ncbi:hypothetical protein GPAL_0538 [Glaciecola pallidula DSM 14239 = ACAM 615]|uniref:Uncharacterized protein n=1 Tax=Brumicola pallidula DSM 14239 = ACAM 615 TaxID=1121922 RepID=K6ZER3_9ALTE|nr:hypothetical protein GPAL_0538 [Glaciecola pallidula DSM 14239 = ACAM 615]
MLTAELFVCASILGMGLHYVLPLFGCKFSHVWFSVVENLIV